MLCSDEGATFEKMDQVREQQERLARLHFELDVHQDLYRSLRVIQRNLG